MNMNEAKSFETDLHLASRIGELPKSEWNQDEKNALIQSARFIKEWTNLRSSILFHMLDNGEETSDEAQSRIQYWKEVMEGKNKSTPELSSGIGKEKKPAAIEILESYRRELAKDILKKAGVLPVQEVEAIRAASQETAIPQAKEPLATDTKQSDQKSTFITANDITVIEEDYIAEFVATHSGNELDEFYHKHLIPAYKAVLTDLQERIKNKPAHIPLDKFRKDNEIFLVHADFLRQQIKLVREKEPTVDNPIPVLTDIVELGTKPVAKPASRQQAIKAYAGEGPLDQDSGMTLPKMVESPSEPPKQSLMSALGSGLKSLFNTVAKKLLPTPRLGMGWGIATGAGLAAGVALATAMHTGDVQTHYPKQIKPMADAAPKAVLAVEATKAPLPALDTPIILEAQPVAKVNSTTAEATPKTASKLVVLATKSFAKHAAPMEAAEEQTAPLPTASPDVSAPIEQQEFDIATFRHDLSTLEKACRQVGKSTEDGVCNGLQPL